MVETKYVVYGLFATGLVLFLAGSISPPLAAWLTSPVRIGLAVGGVALMGGSFVWAQFLD